MFDPTLYASRALTIAAELVPDGERVEQLERDLKCVKDDLNGNNVKKDEPLLEDYTGDVTVNDFFLPGELPDTHFTRFVIVDDAKAPPDNRLPPVLVWESNHDGDPEEYLRKVQAGALDPDKLLRLDRIFGACVDYPGVASGDDWVAWMMERRVRAEAFYAGYRGVPKTRVDAAYRVHMAIRHFVDDNRDMLCRKTPLELHQLVRAHLQQSPPPKPMRPGDLEPAVTRGWGFTARKYGTYAFLGLAVILLATVFLPFTIIWYLLLRHHEKTEVPDSFDRPVHGEPELMANEDRIVQNQLTHIVDIKPGLFRYFTQRVVLFAIDRLARVVFVHGNLGGITSIHFARWVILHDKRNDPPRRRHRLLFFSNYDFSWESYLGEFVDRASSGLTAVWSNTEGYPRTFRLVDQGADDEERFKQWARNHQIASHVWWSGVRYSTVENVNNDVEIHRGAMRKLEPEEADRWVTRL